MCFHDLQLLGVKFNNKFYVDCCLPFGVAISCTIFKDVANLIQWIAENKADARLVCYLDDFFTSHIGQTICKNIMSTLLDVCSQVGMPMAPDKFVPPCQVTEFLGLLLDSPLTVVNSGRTRWQTSSR